MKASFLIAAGLGLLLAGCGEQSDKPASSTNAAASGGSLLTAPVDYLGTVTKQQQSAVKTVDTAALNQAVQLFNVQEGRLPKDLNELVTQKYIAKIPDAPAGTKIVYDANTGQVKVVKQ